MKVFVALAVLFCGFSSARDQRLSSGCYDGNIDVKICCNGITDWWVHLPDPEDCGKFYQCDNGKAVHKDCPGGLHWSVAADQCEWPQTARCSSGSKPTTTSRPSSTTQRVSTTTTRRPSTTTQDSSTTSSENNLPEGCYNGRIDAKTCCNGITDWWVHLPDPDDCGKFYQCDNGKAVHKDCPGGLHWSVAADQCEWPQIARCSFESKPTTTSTSSTTQRPSTTTTRRPSTTTQGSSTTSSENNLPEGCYNGRIDAKTCCNGITDWWVHLPDPEDCGKFYQCENGKAVHKDCPDGLHWSVAADQCEWPQIARCSFESKPTTTSTPLTTQRPNTTTTRRPSTTTQGSSITSSENNMPEGCYNGRIDAKTCCNGITDWWIHLPDPEDCGKFYQCDNGKAVHKDCPDGLHWSVAADQCEWPQIARCSFESKPTTTSTPLTTQRPNTTTTRRPSTTTQGSSTTSSENNLPERCYNGSIDAKTCCNGITDWWVHLPDPEDCGKFYQCDNGKAVHKDCPDGLHWSVAADQCEWPQIARCSFESKPTTTSTPLTTQRPNTTTTRRPSTTTQGSSTTSSENNLPEGCYNGRIDAKTCCNGITDWWVHLPDPEDCGKFYQCDNGKAVHKDCPGGLHWSVVADQCEWPQIAGCSFESKPTTTSTSSTTQRPITTTTRRPSTTTQGSSTISSENNLPEGCYNGSIDAKTCCNGITDWWVHLPDPEDCGKFYQCDNGKAVHKDCPGGLHWSVAADQCEWPQIARCSFESKPTTTSTPLTTQRPNTTTTRRPSTTTQGSSTTSSENNLPEGCYNGRIDAKTCCNGITDWWVHLPDPEDCGKFYQCDNGKAVHKDCPGGLHWSVAADQCEWPQIAGCSFESKPTTTSTPLTTQRPNTTTTRRPSTTTQGSSTTSSENNLPEGCYNGRIDAKTCCNGITDWWVHLPDPEDCGKFYQCDNGKAVHKDCPGGLHWSVAADQCEWPQIAKCIFGSKPTTTSTPSTTRIPSTTTTKQPSTTTTRPPTPDPEDDKCAPKPINHQCIIGLLPVEVCCSEVKTYHKLELANGKNCSSYYKCINGKAILQDCPTGLHWSIRSERCEWPTVARCNSTTTPKPEKTPEGNHNVSIDCLYGDISAEECCKDVPYSKDVLLQNNADCHTYIQCVHGRPMVRPCPANLWWSVTRNRCEWQQNATCIS